MAWMEAGSGTAESKGAVGAVPRMPAALAVVYLYSYSQKPSHGI